MEYSENSISLSLSKEDIGEEMSMFEASMEDASSRVASQASTDFVPVITNEKIQKGDVILEIYTVTSNEIRGGMGSVWCTYHKNWNVELAMKRPQPRFFAEGGSARKEEFIKECENWIKLGLHPCVVSCYYVREIGGVPTIFSEWMNGGSLRDRIRDGSLYEGKEISERLMDIAIQASGGLLYSHKKGLIHQDVKPGNLLLTKDWNAKIADFGLAKAASNVTSSSLPLSTGYTLEYCPKEQAQGAPAERWMDIYAWALVVIEMYSGKRLWTTGAEAKDSIERLFSCYRVPLPNEMCDLLKDCLNKKFDSFVEIENRLLVIFKKEFGREYSRPMFKAINDTADSLNNRALSFLDLGIVKEAERLWEKACEINPNHLSSFYNKNLYEWRVGRISGEIMKQRMLGIRDQTAAQPLFDDLMHQIDLEMNNDAMQTGRKKVLEYSISYNTCVAQYGSKQGDLFIHYEMPGAGFSRWKSTDGEHTLYYVGSGKQYVTVIAVSDDDSKFAFADRSGIIEVYEKTDSNEYSCVNLLWRFTQTEDGYPVDKELEEKLFFPHEVSVLAFSPDGQYLFSASMECESVLFDLRSGKRLFTTAPGYAVSFDPDGSRFAFGPKDSSTLEIRDIPSGRLTAILRDFPDDILAVRYMENGGLIVSCFGGSVFKLDDSMKTDDSEFRLPVICGPLETSAPGCYLRGGYPLTPLGVKVYPGIPGNSVIAFTPDGELGITINGNLCNLKNGKCLYTYGSEDKNANIPVLSRDGKNVFVPNSKNEGWEWPVLRDWDKKAYWMLSVITSYEQSVDRKNRITELLEQGSHALEISDGAAAVSVLNHLHDVPAVDEDERYVEFCKKAAHLLKITGIRSIRKDELSCSDRDTLTEKLCPWYMHYEKMTTSVLFKKKEYNTIVYETTDGHADLYAPEKSGERFYAAMSRNHLLAAAEDDQNTGRITVWDLEMRRQIGHFKDWKGSVTGMCFSPDNRFIAAAGGNRIVIRQLQSGAVAGRFTYEGDYIYNMAFDESGKYLAYAVKDRISVIRISDGCLLHEFTSQIEGKDYLHESVIAIAFSLDGKRIWSLDEGVRNSLKLWDLDQLQDPLLTATVETSGLRICMRPEDDDTKLYLYTDFAEDEVFDSSIESFTVDYYYEPADL